MSPRLKLYGTSACHLCDQARELLERLGLGYEKVDIAGDHALVEKYASRIPVLHCPVSGLELGWPFDGTSLRAFILKTGRMTVTAHKEFTSQQ